jgi:opacity protein-like surface antigen
MRRILTLTALLAATATPALAQTYPQPGRPYGAYPGGVPAAIADQHRYETDRLRYQAQSSADQARQQQVETQLRLRAIEAAREPAASYALPPRPLYSPDQERTLRQSAAERRQQTAQGMSQIDDWLNRPQ